VVFGEAVYCRRDTAMIAFLREFDGESVAIPTVKPPFKPERARKQHAAYVKLIRELGLDVELLRPSDNLV